MLAVDDDEEDEDAADEEEEDEAEEDEEEPEESEEPEDAAVFSEPEPFDEVAGDELDDAPRLSFR